MQKVRGTFVLGYIWGAAQTYLHKPGKRRKYTDSQLFGFRLARMNTTKSLSPGWGLGASANGEGMAPLTWIPRS